MVKWSTIIKPRKLSGLGVRVARTQNTALLDKLIDEVLNATNKLWVSILSAKCIKEGNLFLACNRKGSPIWNSMMKALDYLDQGIVLKIGDGNTNMWYQPWVLRTLQLYFACCEYS